MMYDAVIIGAGAAGWLRCANCRGRGCARCALRRWGGSAGGSTPCTTRRLRAAIELGAEFVHGRPPEIFDLIAEARLPVVERVHEIHHPEGDGAARDDGAMWGPDVGDGSARRLADPT